jgi:hypothetical protein
MKQDAHEQPKIQERKGPPKVIYPSHLILLRFHNEGNILR